MRTRDGGRWGLGGLHKVLTRTTYTGRHQFNTHHWKTSERKPEIERAGPTLTPQALATFARQARKRMRDDKGGYRRDHLRALAQRVEVDEREVRIMGSKGALLRTLVAASGGKSAGIGVPSFVPKWRARRDSNSRPLDFVV